MARRSLAQKCGKAELWLSPFLRCSDSVFQQQSGEIPQVSREFR